jgi:proline iminopeptidase
VWEQYESVIPESERGNMLDAYYRRLTGDDESVRLEAARAWSIWEGSTSKLFPDQNLIDDFGEAHKALSLARIEAHSSSTMRFSRPTITCSKISARFATSLP